MFKVAIAFIFSFTSLFAKNIPNIQFEVNRKAALFAQVYFEQLYGDLHDEIVNSFATKLDHPERTQSEFIECLIAGKVEHKFINGKFTNLWNKALGSYDRIFDCNADILNERKQELTSYLGEVVIDQLLDFSPVFKFYNSSLSEDTIFKVYIYPTEKSGVFAGGFENNLFLRFCYGNKTASFCSLLTQICHKLFNKMDPEKARSMENFFQLYKSKYAKAAYLILDEVLAYAIGEIGAHSKLLGSADSRGNRHSNEGISRVAIAILPTIQAYLNSEKSLDNNFYSEFTKTVRLQYPKSAEEYNVMLSNISLIVENGLDLAYCYDSLKSRFPITKVSFKPSGFTTVFIGKNLGDMSLISISSKIPNKPSDFLFITRDASEKLFVIIKTNDEAKIKLAIEKLIQQKEVKLDHLEDL